MTIPLYALAIVGIGAGAVYSYQKIDQHQAEFDEAADYKKRTVRLENTTAKAQRKLDDLPEKSTALKAKLDVLVADIDDLQIKKDNLTGKVKTLTTQVEGQQAELEAAEEIIAKFEEAFEAENVPIEGIGDYTKQLKEEQEALASELEELLVVKEEAESKLGDSQNKLNDYKKREADRAKSLSENSMSSLITAVNSDWGFVVIKPHAGMTITEDTQLLVVRGAQNLARVSINVVEPNRVIADIDFDSLAPGARVRAGDRVILAQAKSR